MAAMIPMSDCLKCKNPPWVLNAFINMNHHYDLYSGGDAFRYLNISGGLVGNSLLPVSAAHDT